MAEPQKFDVNTDEGAKALEEINGNIERVKSLKVAGEETSELEEGTEKVIAALAGKGSISAKKDARDALRAALETKPEPSTAVRHVAQGTVVEKTWDQYEGVQELVNLGAEKIASGVKAHLKVSKLAKDVAAVVFDMWTRIPNKDGNPDILGDSDQAKKASAEMLRKAGEGFDDTHDTKEALRALNRSVQDQRSDVRAEWLRSLDHEGEEGDARRALVAKVLEGKPADKPASEWVASTYKTSTLGQTEKRRLEYHARKAVEAGTATDVQKALVAGAAKDEDTSTPDERVVKVADKLIRDVTAGKPEDFENASKEVREQTRAKLEAAVEALRKMIAATI